MTDEIDEGAIEVELIDLGDATAETKQIAPVQLVPDSWYGWGYPY
jgi:hypothetical protein